MLRLGARYKANNPGVCLDLGLETIITIHLSAMVVLLAKGYQTALVTTLMSLRI